MHRVPICIHIVDYQSKTSKLVNIVIINVKLDNACKFIVFVTSTQKKHFFHQSKVKMKHTTKALACTSIAKYSHKWKGPYNPYIYIYITLKFQEMFVAFHHIYKDLC
jgi:hypothetical protein